MAAPASNTGGRSVVWYVLTGLTIGLVYGLLEAATSLLLKEGGVMVSWRHGTSVDGLLYGPIVYGLAYLVLAILLFLPSLIFRRVPWDGMLTWALATLSAYFYSRLLGEWFSPLTAILLGLGVGAVIGRWYLANGERHARQIFRLIPGAILLVTLVAIGSQVIKRVKERRATDALPGAAAGAPNILLLILDTQRADHLTPYGYQRPTTPRLAQLAAEGTLFEWAVSSAPTTLPSHASILTGRRVREHRAGVRGRRTMGKAWQTIPELLRTHGYTTGGFIANVFWAGHQTGLNRGFIHYEDFYGTPYDGFARTMLGQVVTYDFLPHFGFVDIPGRKHAATVNQELLDWIDEQDADRPFFAMLNYMDVHAPYQPPKPFLGRFSPPRYHPSRIEVGAWDEIKGVPPDSVLNEWRDRYDESLMYLDHHIGLLLDSLEGRGLSGHTLVIVTADHGESFGEHGTVHHGGSLHGEQVHVPLMLRQPGVVPRGLRVTTPVDLRSIAPTIAQASRSASRYTRPSLFVYLDSLAVGHDPAISVIPPAGHRDREGSGDGWEVSLYQDDWHVLAHPSGAIEVYRVSQDPAELRNLASSPEGQVIVRNVRGVLKDLLAPMPDTEP